MSAPAMQEDFRKFKLVIFSENTICLFYIILLSGCLEKVHNWYSKWVTKLFLRHFLWVFFQWQTVQTFSDVKRHLLWMFYQIEHKSKIESGLVTEGNLPIWVKFSIFQRFSPKPETDENKKVLILFQQKKERA